MVFRTPFGLLVKQMEKQKETLTVGSHCISRAELT